MIRDITRKIAGNESLEHVFAQPLSLARRVKDQRQRERGRKIYSLHAPEVECIGKGKAHKPYEFGVKVSVATPLQRCRGGQFVAHVQALWTCLKAMESTFMTEEVLHAPIPPTLYAGIPG